jgi:hypothetical protein
MPAPSALRAPAVDEARGAGAVCRGVIVRGRDDA